MDQVLANLETADAAFASEIEQDLPMQTARLIESISAGEQTIISEIDQVVQTKSEELIARYQQDLHDHQRIAAEDARRRLTAGESARSIRQLAFEAREAIVKKVVDTDKFDRFRVRNKNALLDGCKRHLNQIETALSGFDLRFIEKVRNSDTEYRRMITETALDPTITVAEMMAAIQSRDISRREALDRKIGRKMMFTELFNSVEVRHIREILQSFRLMSQQQFEARVNTPEEIARLL